MQLKGSLESVEIGDQFLQISGWVAREDGGQAEAPLRFEFDDGTFGEFGLNFRPDLASAQIANGVAAFSAMVPTKAATTGADFSFDIVDLKGVRGNFAVSAAQVKPFAALGAFDNITRQTVGGWLYDPKPMGLGAAPGVYFENEYIAKVEAVFERPDLNFDTGGDQKIFGFEFDGERLWSEMARLNDRYRGRPGRLSLVVGGHEIATALIERAEDNIAVQANQVAGPDVRKYLVSDFLAQRLYPARDN